jgi:hypothetical protein
MLAPILGLCILCNRQQQQLHPKSRDVQPRVKWQFAPLERSPDAFAQVSWEPLWDRSEPLGHPNRRLCPSVRRGPNFPPEDSVPSSPGDATSLDDGFDHCRATSMATVEHVELAPGAVAARRPELWELGRALAAA